MFRSVPEPSAYVGEAIAYRDGLIVEDNCCGEVRIDVDTSAVNPNAAGDYPIIYTATDVSGNRSTAKSTVHIGASRISQESLNRKIDEIIAANITANATIETQLREVYAYIRRATSGMPRPRTQATVCASPTKACPTEPATVTPTIPLPSRSCPDWAWSTGRSSARPD